MFFKEQVEDTNLYLQLQSSFLFLPQITEWLSLERVSGGHLVQLPQIIIDLALFAMKMAAISVTHVLAIFSFLTI